MTIAERRLIDAIKEIITAYDDDPDYLYAPMNAARKLVDMLEPEA